MRKARSDARFTPNSGHVQRKSRCPLYPSKQTSLIALRSPLRAMGRHSPSFNQPHWASDKTGGRTFSPQHFCRGKIDDLLELSTFISFLFERFKAGENHLLTLFAASIITANTSFGLESIAT